MPLGWNQSNTRVSLVRFAHSWEILSALEDKIRIPARPCNILYVYDIGQSWTFVLKACDMYCVILGIPFYCLLNSVLILKVILSTFKIFHNMASPYLACLVSFKTPSCYNLRISADNTVLQYPLIKSVKTLGFATSPYSRYVRCSYVMELPTSWHYR